ncbi:hypothetical protein QOT17_010072 [Balamuthia mandrillaris]
MNNPLLSLSILLLAITTTSPFLLLHLPTASAESCYRNTTLRGVGTIPNTCGQGLESDGGQLCYPLCNPGYTGVGPVCYQQCDTSTHVDTGLFCQARFGSGANTFPKDTYTRAPHTMSCPSGKDKQAGLCYRSCPPGFAQEGPVCWQPCPADSPHPCGVACTESEGACVKEILDVTATILKLIAEGISCGSGDLGGCGGLVGEAGGLIEQLNMLICEQAIVEDGPDDAERAGGSRSVPSLFFM